eukprot:m.90924 g.90924  ORF g.90924 m.90924 type:complete len:234 (-) comp13281_c0_seq3:95-796(-)
MEDAVKFCRTASSAVVVTVWPTARSQVNSVRKWIEQSCKASILFEKTIALRKKAGVPTCMALYYGEDWIHTNCWYMESPIPSGPPSAPYAGAKWKAALTFPGQDDDTQCEMTVFVVDAEGSQGALWRGKYQIREQLRRAVPGALGNCCMHLTDDQTDALEAWKVAPSSGQGGSRGGYECDSSYAFHCARVLLDEASVAFLNDADYEAAEYENKFAVYCEWLAARTTTEVPTWS